MSPPADLDFVRRLRVRLLAELPLPTSLLVRMPDGEELWLTTSRDHALALSADGTACCTPLEYEALAAALELDACTTAHALEELARKRAPLGYRLTLLALVGGRTDREGRTIRCPVRGPLIAVPGVELAMRERSLRWTFADLFAAIGAVLEHVLLEDDDVSTHGRAA